MKKDKDEIKKGGIKVAKKHEWATITAERVGVKIRLEALTTPPDPAKPQDWPIQPVWYIVIKQGSEDFPEEIHEFFISRGYEHSQDPIGRSVYRSKPIGHHGEGGLAGMIPEAHAKLIEADLMPAGTLEVKL